MDYKDFNLLSEDLKNEYGFYGFNEQYQPLLHYQTLFENGQLQKQQFVEKNEIDQLNFFKENLYINEGLNAIQPIQPLIDQRSIDENIKHANYLQLFKTPMDKSNNELNSQSNLPIQENILNQQIQFLGKQMKSGINLNDKAMKKGSKSYGTYTFSGENISRLLFKEGKIFNYNYFKNIFVVKKFVNDSKIHNGEIFYKRLDKFGKISRHDSLQICDCGFMRTHGEERSQLHFTNTSNEVCYTKYITCKICKKSPENLNYFTASQLYEHLSQYHMKTKIQFTSMLEWFNNPQNISILTENHKNLIQIEQDNSEYFLIQIHKKLFCFFKCFIEQVAKEDNTIEKFMTNSQNYCPKNCEQLSQYFTCPFNYGYTTYDPYQQEELMKRKNDFNNASQFIEPPKRKKLIVLKDESQQVVKKEIIDLKFENNNNGKPFNPNRQYRNNGESISTKLFTQKRIFFEKYFERISEWNGQYFYSKKIYDCTTCAKGKKHYPRKNKSDQQQICECGFMRVNAKKRHFTDHFFNFTCLTHPKKKLTFNTCEICGQQSEYQTFLFSELYLHLKSEHHPKNELFTEKKLISIPSFQLSDLYNFYVKGRLCILNRLKEIENETPVLSEDDFEYVHFKSNSKILDYLMKTLGEQQYNI